MRLWYLATSAYGQRYEQHTRHEDRAVELFPGDANLLFLAGSFHETFASPRMQSLVRSIRLPSGVSHGIGAEQSELREAEELLRRALEPQPAFVEARIRLGRVLYLLGRHEAAARELQQAVAALSSSGSKAADDDGLLRYYAEMFLGAASESLGRNDSARVSYARAAALYPDAPSPRLALSQLALRGTIARPPSTRCNGRCGRRRAGPIATTPGGATTSSRAGASMPGSTSCTGRSRSSREARWRAGVPRVERRRTAAQTPTFSTGVEAIRVDVLVTDGDRPLLGLGPADFEVRDNGVVQNVAFVSAEKLPLNVILALDTSASVLGEPLDHLRSAGLALLERLEPEDQAALVTFSHEVRLREPLTRDVARVGRALAQIEPLGETAVIDASYAAIVLGDTDLGRDLVIVFSDGVDTSSWLREERVLDAARRSDVVVYGVSVRGADRPEFLRELSDLTGGGLLEVDSTRDLRAAFVGILDEFRHRYLLNYSAVGVSPDGWHQLAVKVKRRGTTVRARPATWPAASTRSGVALPRSAQPSYAIRSWRATTACLGIVTRAASPRISTPAFASVTLSGRSKVFVAVISWCVSRLASPSATRPPPSSLRLTETASSSDGFVSVTVRTLGTHRRRAGKAGQPGFPSSSGTVRSGIFNLAGTSRRPYADGTSRMSKYAGVRVYLSPTAANSE